MLLHLAASYIRQADIIFLVVFYYCYFGILNSNFCHRILKRLGFRHKITHNFDI